MQLKIKKLLKLITTNSLRVNYNEEIYYQEKIILH